MPLLLHFPLPLNRTPYCAPQVMNSNSSRFGKFLELKFSRDLHIEGVTIAQYLLEKSSVSQQVRWRFGL